MRRGKLLLFRCYESRFWMRVFKGICWSDFRFLVLFLER